MSIVLPRDAANINNPIDADLRWTVERREAGDLAGALSPAEREMFLAANQLVPVGHEVLDPILAEIRAARADNSPAATSRAIYDWVTDNVEYKKVGTGWGNGDTFWACSERYGNCTDFHSLFISLARFRNVPARFEIGFSLPPDDGSVGGYHCWAWYADGDVWKPVDISEADKNPALNDYFFGNLTSNRVALSTGRDLVLSPPQSGSPLNFFVHPYAELDGQPVDPKNIALQHEIRWAKPTVD